MLLLIGAASEGGAAECLDHGVRLFAPLMALPPVLFDEALDALLQLVMTGGINHCKLAWMAADLNTRQKL